MSAKDPEREPKKLKKLRKLLAAASSAAALDEEVSWTAAEECVDQLRQEGLEPTLVSSFDLEGGEGFTVWGTTHRELRFGSHSFASWSFDMSGETGQYTTGFWVHRDFEEPSVPEEFLDVIGIDLDGPIEGFPDDWGEALALLGLCDEDENEEDEEEKEGEGNDAGERSEKPEEAAERESCARPFRPPFEYREDVLEVRHAVVSRARHFVLKRDFSAGRLTRKAGQRLCRKQAIRFFDRCNLPVPNCMRCAALARRLGLAT